MRLWGTYVPIGRVCSVYLKPLLRDIDLKVQIKDLTLGIYDKIEIEIDDRSGKIKTFRINLSYE
jgi:hypothetical protein